MYKALVENRGDTKYYATTRHARFELDTNGNVTWNTFMGGTASHNAAAIAVDGVGNVYVAGDSERLGAELKA